MSSIPSGINPDIFYKTIGEAFREYLNDPRNVDLGSHYGLDLFKLTEHIKTKIGITQNCPGPISGEVAEIHRRAGLLLSDFYMEQQKKGKQGTNKQ